MYPKEIRPFYVPYSSFFYKSDRIWFRRAVLRLNLILQSDLCLYQHTDGRSVHVEYRAADCEESDLPTPPDSRANHPALQAPNALHRTKRRVAPSGKRGRDDREHHDAMWPCCGF